MPTANDGLLSQEQIVAMTLEQRRDVVLKQLEFNEAQARQFHDEAMQSRGYLQALEHEIAARQRDLESFQQDMPSNDGSLQHD